MPRRITKDDLLAENSRLSRDNTIRMIAMQCLAVERPQDTQHCETDGWRYTFHGFRLTAPHGGVIVEIATTDGQAPDVRAYYLDDADRRWNVLINSQVLCYAAVTRIRLARQRLIDRAA